MSGQPVSGRADPADLHGSSSSIPVPYLLQQANITCNYNVISFTKLGNQRGKCPSCEHSFIQMSSFNNERCTGSSFASGAFMFMFAICRRPSVYRLSVVCLSSVTLVHPTQAIEIFGNVSTPFGTFAICDPLVKILRRSSQGNPSVGGLNQRGVEKYSDFGPFQGYISETV